MRFVRGWLIVAVLGASSALIFGCGTSDETIPHNDRGTVDGNVIGQVSMGLSKCKGGTNGDGNFCSDTCTCTQGQGDCDDDANCTDGTVCCAAKGLQFGFATKIDVCAPAHCRDRKLDGDETQIDCGGSCGSNCSGGGGSGGAGGTGGSSAGGGSPDAGAGGASAGGGRGVEADGGDAGGWTSDASNGGTTGDSGVTSSGGTTGDSGVTSSGGATDDGVASSGGTTGAGGCTTDLYWVGGTNTWNGTAGTKWATISGGPGGHAIPTPSDTVHIDGNSGTGTVTIGPSSVCASLDSTGFSGTIAGSTGLTISGGGLTWGSGITLTYSGQLTFADTSGTTRLITSNGKQFQGNITINGPGGVFQLADTESSLGKLTITAGTFDFNSQGAQFSSVSYGGGGTKAVLLGDSQITITGTGNAWSAIATGTTQATGGSSKITYTDSSSSAKTFSGSGLTFDDITLGGTGTGAFTIALTGTMRDLSVSDASSTGVTLSSTFTARNVDFNGFTGALSQTKQLTLTGSLTMAPGMTDSGTGNISLNGTSGTQTVTSNGIHFGQPLVVNNPGATASLADAFYTTRPVTLTAGALTTNGQATTASGISSSNTNVRSLTLDDSNVTLTGSGTVFGLATTTNLTFSAVGSSLTLTDATAASKALAFNSVALGDLSLTGSGSGSYTVSTGTSASVNGLYVSNTGGATVRLSGAHLQTANVDFTGFTGTYAGGAALLIGGDLTAGAAMTWSGKARDVFDATSGVHTITSNGVQINSQFEFDGVGGEWHLADDLALVNAAVPTLHFLNGTFRSMGHAIQAQEVDGSTSLPHAPGARTVDISGSVVTASAPADPWYFPDLTSCTLVTTGSTIILNAPGTANHNFHGGGGTYDTLQLAGAGGGSFTIDQGNIFGTFSDVDATAHSILFEGSATQTMRLFAVSGSTGNDISLRSKSSGMPFILSTPANAIVCDYLDIKDSMVTGGARWFAGLHSVNSGNDNGWQFTQDPDDDGDNE